MINYIFHQNLKRAFWKDILWKSKPQAGRKYFQYIYTTKCLYTENMKNADTSIIKIKKIKQRLYKRRYMKGK